MRKVNRFEICKSADSKYYFKLIANNNEILVTSETYESLENCKKGIKAVKKYSKSAKIEKVAEEV